MYSNLNCSLWRRAVKMQDELSIEQIESYSAREEWSRVVSACERETEPEAAARVYPFLAKAYAHQGKLDKAIAIYQKLLENLPKPEADAGTGNPQFEKAEVYGELGLLYSKKHQLDRAVEYYRQALALKPDWVQLQFNLAVVFHQQENWKMAVTAYQKVLELAPNYAAAYFNLGLVYQRQNNLPAAAENYRQALGLQPERVGNYLNLGKVLAKQQQTTEAIATFKEGLKVDPTQGTLHHALGLSYWLVGQLELAIFSFEYAIAVAPEMAIVHRDLAKLWQQLGDYRAASICWRRAIELEPDNVSAYSQCANALQRGGRLQEAIDCWQQVVSLQPAFVRAYIRQAIVLEPHDLLTRAKAICARFLAVLEQKSNYSEIYHYLWQTYRHLGDIWFEGGGIELAATYYQQALEIKTNEPELYLRLGTCLARQKRLDAAIAIYRAGLIVSADCRELKIELSKIIRSKSSLQLFPVDKNLAWLPQKLYHHTQDWVRDCQLANFEYTTVAWEQNTSHQHKITGKRLPEPIMSLPSIEKSGSKTEGRANRLDLTGSLGHRSQFGNEPVTAQLSVETYLSPTMQLATSAKQTHIVSEETLNTTFITDSLEISSTSDDVPGKSLISQARPYRSELFGYFTGKQLEASAYQCNFQPSIPIKSLSPFVTTIPQGRIWIAPQRSSWQFGNDSAVITPDGYLLKDLSSDYPWFLPTHLQEASSDRYLIPSEEIPPAVEIDGKVAVLLGLTGNGYADWMLDILPRIELIRRSGIELDSIDWLVVDRFDRSFQEETLALLEIPPSKILSGERNSHLVATELIVPAFPGYRDWVSSETVKFLRQTFLEPSMASSQKFPAKIYLSRLQASDKKVINEPEVVNLLGNYGFQTIFLEEMSLSQQIALFAQAEAIVAPHGLELANLAFCQPDTIVIELFCPNYLRTNYWAISKHLRLQHYYLIGDRFDCDFLRQLMYLAAAAEDILVDLKALETVLKTTQIQ